MKDDPVYSAGGRMTAVGPTGIGGWLALPVIGLFFSPLWALKYLGGDLIPLLTSSVWSSLTTPGGAAYHSLWAPLIILEVYANAVVLGVSVTALVFLFQKRQMLPKLMVGFLTFVTVLNLIDVAGLTVIGADLSPALGEEMTTSVMPQLARALLGAAIWIPYFLLSKRVKNTFVR